METKKCQNCNNKFNIEVDDFLFYQKIKVPPPTFCPECRLKRRLIWRNERNLYRRKCDLCSKSTLTTFDSKNKIYCHTCWWSDKWNYKDYGKEYDFSKSFFEQYNDLLLKVPLCGLFNINQVNSEYSNYTYQSKNCYLNFASDMNEDTGYLYHSIENRNSYDMLGSRKNENCYELLDCEECYNSSYLVNSVSCLDSSYLYDCHNCVNSLGCCGLRNAKYHILNEKYQPEDYKKEINKLNLNSHNGRKKFRETFNKLLEKHYRKFINSRQITNCTGDYLKNAQNCKECFDIEGPAKDLKYCIYGVTKVENSYDLYGFGVNVEDCYDCLGAGDNVQNVKFSCYTFSGAFDISYSCFCNSSSNLFGCVSARKGQYMILNKQYTKEEYEELIPKIIQQMNDLPYVDKKSNIYKYGEFFPPELSPFAYNETIAQEYYPLTKEQALSKGYRWKDKEERNYTIDIKNEDIPDNIENTDESIINKVIECKNKDNQKAECTEAYKIIPEEYQFYRRMKLPLPRLCPNCRHYNRLKQRNPLKLWHRKCMKDGCNNSFETSYSPERPEIIYCEQCYQSEIY
jgi:hypothetical protein